MLMLPPTYLPCTRQRPLADGMDTGRPPPEGNSLNARILCHSPKGAALTDLVLIFPGFYAALPEADLPFPYDVRASIEYPEGQITRLYFAGDAEARVRPGRRILHSDPAPLHIPADARFHLRLHMRWAGGQLPLASFATNTTAGEWCAFGDDLPDASGDAAARANSFPYPAHHILGPAVGVFGRFSAPTAVLGIIGDSISQGAGDLPDPIHGGMAIERALRNLVPCINLARNGEHFAGYLARPDGRSAILRDRCTHLLLQLGHNDMLTDVPAALIQERLQRALAPWLVRGVPVFATTLLPWSASSDGFATRESQTWRRASAETERRRFNDWIRGNGRAIGLHAVLDYAAAVDPTDSGLWNADGNPGTAAIGVATLEGGGIVNVTTPLFTAPHRFGGALYPPSTTLPCHVLRLPDDPFIGRDAHVRAQTGPDGNVIGFEIDRPGRYSTPPLISPAGRWTNDGLHPTARGYNAIIAATGFGPHMLPPPRK